jgi:PilZ domain
MHDRVQDGRERRAAARHRVAGNAEVFWGGGPGGQLSISDVSACGCLLRGEALPDVGTRVVVALALGDLPSVRLTGLVVRTRTIDEGSQEAAVRFLLPARCMPGMSRLLEDVGTRS